MRLAYAGKELDPGSDPAPLALKPGIDVIAAIHCFQGGGADNSNQSSKTVAAARLQLPHQRLLLVVVLMVLLSLLHPVAGAETGQQQLRLLRTVHMPTLLISLLQAQQQLAVDCYSHNITAVVAGVAGVACCGSSCRRSS